MADHMPNDVVLNLLAKGSGSFVRMHNVGEFEFVENREETYETTDSNGMPVEGTNYLYVYRSTVDGREVVVQENGQLYSSTGPTESRDQQEGDAGTGEPQPEPNADAEPVMAAPTNGSNRRTVNAGDDAQMRSADGQPAPQAAGGIATDGSNQPA